MTNKNPNGNQTTVDAGEEEKCRSVLPDGEKSASEGLLKAVSMRSPMPSRGIPMGSGAVAHSCALRPQGSPVRTSAVAPVHDPVERCPVLALGLAGLSSRAHASRTSSFRRCERGGGTGARRVFSLLVFFDSSESFRQVIRVSTHVNFRSFARFRETIVQMRV